MNAASTEAARVGFEGKLFRQVNLHHACYHSLRERFGLPAQMAVRSIAKSVAVFARDRRKAPVFRPGGAVGYDARMVTHRPVKKAVSLLTLNGRVELPYAVGSHQAALVAEGHWGEAKLVRRGTAFYLLVAIDKPETESVEPVTTVGVDLGINNIAVLSTGEIFAGELVQKTRRRYAAIRTALQSKGTRSAKRKLRKLSGRESRYVKGVNHLVSRRIVDHAKALRAGLVLEDLTGIRRKRLGAKVVRTLLNSWAFAQLRNFIAYKAALAGIVLTVVKPQDTSRTCSACSHCEKANRRGKKFACKSCGFAAHADANAATNIARLGGQGADVNRPMATTACPSVASPRL